MAEPGAVPRWDTEMKRLAPGVHAYVQAGGSWGLSNAGVVAGDRDVLLVDTLFTLGLTETLLDAARAVTDKPCRWLLYTHHHGDHTFGSPLLPGATIVAHRQCKWVLDNHPANMESLKTRMPQFDFTGAVARSPDLVFDGQIELDLGHRAVQVIHNCPAHTLGDAVAYLPEEGIVFCGDLLFLYSTPVAQEGTVRGWLQYMEFLLRLPATTFVPGHGPVCDKSGLTAEYEYLYRVYLQGTEFHRRGVPAREAARRIDVSAFREWAAWERVLINLESLYRELDGRGVYEAPLDLRAMGPAMEELRGTVSAALAS